MYFVVKISVLNHIYTFFQIRSKLLKLMLIFNAFTEIQLLRDTSKP